MTEIIVLHTELEKFDGPKSGFSLLIKNDNRKILFDVSFLDDIQKNTQKANIPLKGIDYLVLSHGHRDHVDGLRFINYSEIKHLLAHPNCFQKKYYPTPTNYAGCPLVLDYLKAKTDVILSKEPFWIKKNKIVFLGEIPRKIKFELSKNPIGYLENGEGDHALDDSAIAIKSENGIILITGCSHSGICNIIEYAKYICKQNTIYVLLGGFHLFDKNIISKTIEFIKKENIIYIHPGHCLNEYAFSEFEKIGGKRIHTLQKFVF